MPAKKKDPKPGALRSRPRDESPDGDRILAKVERRMEKQVQSTSMKQSIIHSVQNHVQASNCSSLLQYTSHHLLSIMGDGIYRTSGIQSIVIEF